MALFHVLYHYVNNNIRIYNCPNSILKSYATLIESCLFLSSSRAIHSEQEIIIHCYFLFHIILHDNIIILIIIILL